MMVAATLAGAQHRAHQITTMMAGAAEAGAEAEADTTGGVSGSATRTVGDSAMPDCSVFPNWMQLQGLT